MTIKEFASLCGCNPQTLRYYDHVDLLKPVKVDQWSSYRYYEEDQALIFVKIKNLQRAGFSIAEIKQLLDQDDAVIFHAFDAKIAEAEQRLQEIRSIQQSYQTEMTTMTSRITEMRENIATSMRKYDPYEEFGIDQHTYETIVHETDSFFDTMMKQPDHYLVLNLSDASDADNANAESAQPNPLANPAYSVVYEKHGWRSVKDFYHEFAALEEEPGYFLFFHLEEAKMKDNVAFMNVLLGMLLQSNIEKKWQLSCSSLLSDDGLNHFWLLKEK